MAIRSLSREFRFIASVILLGLMLLMIWSAWDNYNQAKQRIVSRLESNGERVASTMLDILNYTEYQLIYTARQIAEHGTDDPRFIHDLLASYTPGINEINYYFWSMFSWVTKENMLTINSQKGILAEPADLSDRDYLKIAREVPGRLIIGNPVSGAISNQRIFPVGLSVTDSDQKLLGFVITGINTLHLKNRLNQLMTDGALHYVFMNAQSINVLQNIESENVFTPERLQAYGISLYKEPPAGLVAHTLPLNIPIPVAYYRTLPKYNLVMAIGYEPSYVTHEIFVTLLPRLMEFAVFGGLLIYLLYLFYQRIVVPIQFLSAAADRLAHGELGSHFQIQGPAEIIQLSESLTHVSRYIDELRLIRQELTRKIRELEDNLAKKPAQE